MVKIIFVLRVNVCECKRNVFWSVFEEKIENLYLKDGWL